MKHLTLLLLSALFLDCDLSSDPADELHEGLAIPAGLSLRAATAVGAGDTLRLYLDSPDTLRRCITAWEDGGLGEFLLEPNSDSMWWRMPAGSVADPRRVVLRARVSDGEEEWRDSLVVMVLEGWPGRVSLLPVAGSRLDVQGRVAVVGADDAVGTNLATVIDVSSVQAPRPIASISTTGWTGDIHLDLPRLMISSGFQLVNLSAPQSPWELGRADTLEFSASVVAGERVYGCRHGDLYILDLSEPTDWRVDHVIPGILGGSEHVLFEREGLLTALGREWDDGIDWRSRVSLIHFGFNYIDFPEDSFFYGGAQTLFFEETFGVPVGNVLRLPDRLYVPDGVLRIYTYQDGLEVFQPLATSCDIPANYVFEAGENRLLCVLSSQLQPSALVTLVDISDPADLVVLQEGLVPGLRLLDARLQGDFLYCLTGDGLQIVWAPAD